MYITLLRYVLIPQSVDESQAMLSQALSKVDSLLNVILSKEYSNDNLESVFKVGEFFQDSECSSYIAI